MSDFVSPEMSISAEQGQVAPLAALFTAHWYQCLVLVSPVTFHQPGAPFWFCDTCQEIKAVFAKSWRFQMVTRLWRTYYKPDLKTLCTHCVTRCLPPPWFSSTWTLRRWTPPPWWAPGHTASVCLCCPVCAPVSHTDCTTAWRAGAQLSC